MRKMHPIIVDCVKRLEQVLEKCAQNSDKEIDLKKMMGNLTMDVIATCAFGTKIDVHSEEKTSDFVTHAQKVFRSSWRMWVFFIVSPVFPQLLKWINFKFTDPSVDRFFRSAVSQLDKHSQNWMNSLSIDSHFVDSVHYFTAKVR